MRYDRGDSFLSDFEPNGSQFSSKSNENCHHDHIPFNMKGKLSPRSYPIECERKKSLRSYPIQCEQKLKYSFLST